jgi:EmrB/QacA subfamily drug resistance transporter
MVRVGPETSSPQQRGRLAVTAVAGLAVVMVLLDLTVVNVALDAINTEFAAPLSALQWTVNGYSLATAALLLSAGSLADRLGRRGVFLIGMSIFTAASLCCALAPGLTWLIVARIIQGFGGALVMGTTVGLIAGVYEGADPRRRQAAIGVYAGMASTASAFGPLIGGALVDAGGWRLVFLINIPIGVAIIAGTLAFVGRQRRREGSRLDLPGAALAALALFVLNYGVLAGTDTRWNRPDVVATLVAAGVLLVAFLIRQRRLGQNALLDLGLFRIPTFVGAVTLGFTSRLASLGLYPFLILWLSGVLGHTPLQVGLTMMAISLPQAIVSLFSGHLARLAPARVLCGAGTAVTGAGVLGASAAVVTASEWTAVLPCLIVMGIGSGIVMPQLVGLAVGVVPADRAGMASGLSNTFFPLGSSTGVAVYGVIMAAVVGGRIADQGVASTIAAGRISELHAGNPAATAELMTQAREAFTAGLSTVLLVAGVVVLGSAVGALQLIRAKDVLVPPRRPQPMMKTKT